MRRSAVPAVLFLFCALTSIPHVFAAEEFFFKKGDRVLFLGDSITEQYQYSTDIELYLTTRFPKWQLSFLNAGISGDTAQGGARRFATHVLAEKPTAITINFGMNDGGYGPFDEKRNAVYVAQTEAMLVAAKEAGVRVALVSPNAVDRRIQERFKLYLETQKQFYAPLRELAAKSGAAFGDQYAVTRAALERMEKDNANDVRPFGDGFHTASPGGLFMAHAILTGLGGAGARQPGGYRNRRRSGENAGMHGLHPRTIANHRLVRADRRSTPASDSEGLGVAPPLRERLEGPQLVRTESERTGRRNVCAVH